MQSRKLYIGNLAFRVTQKRLREIFSPCGEIENIRLIKDRKTGRSKGFAFITFADAKGAENGLMQDGVELEGRPLRVNVALERASDQGEQQSAPDHSSRQSAARPVNERSSGRLWDWIGGILCGLLLGWLITLVI
ncbi:MAG: hypothetical protein D6698_03755 [Gammaproteobacteria bacterium]|nr:MAG: hypothetical protein D6698_03755 [Gammaproteobacteria bacterium]